MDISNIHRFEDPNHTPSNGRLEGDFFSPSQKKLFEQFMTQDAQHQGRKDEERRKKRKQEFEESLRRK